MRFLLFVLLLGFSFVAFSQKPRDAASAFSSKQYHAAIPLLSKDYGKAKTRAEKGKIAFQLGECARILGRDEQALDWYQKAYDNQYGVDALREVSFALKRLERYAEAKESFKNLGIEIGSPYEYRREINACDIAMGWKKIPQPEYQVTLLEESTSAADYAPAFYKERELFFSSDRNNSSGEAIYNWTGNRYSDFFVFNPDNTTVRNYGAPFNTADNEGTISFTADFREAYFTRCTGARREDAFCRILVSEFDGNAWKAPRQLEFQERGINYGHPSISADGKTLYFSCQHPDGWGGYDLYTVQKAADGGWSEPKILSRTVNTIGNEQFPFIYGDTLYFSSDFHPGMGGLDIFRTYRMPNGEWAPVFNLKPPLNSGSDDFAIAISPEKSDKAGVVESGFFSSNRPGAGNDDLYRFDRYPPPPAPPVPALAQRDSNETKRKGSLRLDVFVLEKIYSNPADPNSKVLGRKPLAAAQLEVRTANGKKTIPLGDDGLYTLLLDPNTEYQFLATKSGYLTNAGKFSSKGLSPSPEGEEQVFEVEIVLDQIFLNREITLENIYYDFDKWDIRADARPTLDALAENLRLNPGIQIQLASHTDCRGNDSYNGTLSQRRAESAVNYLIEAGIEAGRLSAKGFGETQPAVSCLCARCTEEEHQANRRTTFAITAQNP